MTAPLAARVLQDILDIVHAQPVLGNVLDVSFPIEMDRTLPSRLILGPDGTLGGTP